MKTWFLADVVFQPVPSNFYFTLCDVLQLLGQISPFHLPVGHKYIILLLNCRSLNDSWRVLLRVINWTGCSSYHDQVTTVTRWAMHCTGGYGNWTSSQLDGMSQLSNHVTFSFAPLLEERSCPGNYRASGCCLASKHGHHFRSEVSCTLCTPSRGLNLFWPFFLSPSFDVIVVNGYENRVLTGVQPYYDQYRKAMEL